MKVEIDIDPAEPIQIVDVGHLRAFIVDLTKYSAYLVNFPSSPTVILEKK